MTEDTSQGSDYTTQPSAGTAQAPVSSPSSTYASEPTGYNQPVGYPAASTYETERSGWTGWVSFAGVMMIIGGSLNAFYGIVALVNDEWVVWTNQGALYLDISQWGAIHLAMGVVMILSGIGVFSGNILARIVGVIVASISLVANFFFMPAYPLWTMVVIVIDVLVIWALTAHGKEMRNS